MCTHKVNFIYQNCNFSQTIFEQSWIKELIPREAKCEIVIRPLEPNYLPISIYKQIRYLDNIK